MSTTAEPLNLPLNKLTAWKGNVRKVGPAVGIPELAASIEAHGLLQSLVVQKDKGGKYAVIAGRRRLLALQSLAKSGSIKATFPVSVNVMDPSANPTEISLVENVQRQNMHPADEFDAFKKLIDEGMPAADVAARFGTTETTVEKRLKLANVSPVLVQEYRDGHLTLQHMMAFAVTNDHEAQEKVWKDLPTYRRNDPDAIRDMLTEGEITAKDRRVKFVGLAAYEKSGGAIRRDLFSDDENGAFILDKDLLSELVTKKLEKIANSLAKEGWRWVEVREQFDHSEWSRCSKRYEEAQPLPVKRQAELDGLNKQLEQLYSEIDGDEENPQIERLQSKIDRLEDRPKTWQSETLAVAGAVVAIGYNGKPELHRGLVRPEDTPKAARTKTVTQEDGSQTQIEEAFRLSAGLTESLTTHRTAALTAALSEKPDVALVALVHTLALQTFYNGHGHDTCLKITVNEPYLKGIEGTKAAEVLEAGKTKWQSKIPGEPDGLWDWCREQTQPVLLGLMAFCVANTVDAVGRKNDRLDSPRFHHANELAKAVGLDMSEWFTTTAENYFSHVSKIGIMEALKEAKVEITPQMEKAKKVELATTAERAVAPSRWLPELLRGPI